MTLRKVNDMRIISKLFCFQGDQFLAFGSELFSFLSLSVFLSLPLSFCFN